MTKRNFYPLQVSRVHIASVKAEYAMLSEFRSINGVADVHVYFNEGQDSRFFLPVSLIAPAYARRCDGINVVALWEKGPSLSGAYGVAHDVYKKLYGMGDMVDHAEDVFRLSAEIESAVDEALKRPEDVYIRAQNALWAIDFELSQLWQYGYWDDVDFEYEINLQAEGKPCEKIIEEMASDGVDLDHTSTEEFKDYVRNRIEGNFLSVERAGFDGDPERDCYRAVITTGGPHIEAQIFFGQKAELVYSGFGFEHRLRMSDEAENALRYACGCEGYY